MSGTNNAQSSKPGPLVTVLISTTFMGLIVAAFKTIYEKLVLSELEKQISAINTQASQLAQNPNLNFAHNNPIEIPA